MDYSATTLLINGDEPTVPPPLLFVPPPRIQPNRIRLSELLRFDAAAPTNYDDAVADGRGDEVAWMASGYLTAAIRRAQQEP